MPTSLALDYEGFFQADQARDTRLVSSVTGRNVALVISNVKEPLPDPVLVRATQKVCGVLNVAGATSIKDHADRVRLFNRVSRLLGADERARFRFGVDGNVVSIGSGGTRVLDGSGTLTGSMTAVETPGLAFAIARQLWPDNPEFWPRTWGHAPRTSETLGYGGEHSSFQLAEKMDSDTIPNPLLHLLWLLQKGASVPGKWNLDLKKYIELLVRYQSSREGYSGILVLSGGAVSAEEVLLALRNDINVLGAVGTGRAADALAHLKHGELDKIDEAGIREHYQTIVDEGLDLSLIDLYDADNPREGQQWLQTMGFGTIL